MRVGVEKGGGGEGKERERGKRREREEGRERRVGRGCREEGIGKENHDRGRK